MRAHALEPLSTRIAASAFAIALAAGLSFPSLAFATVSIDNNELAQGANAVGGGTATLADSVLDMVDVTAGEVTTDQDLTVNFNGGNDVGMFSATGSAEVEVNFSGDNEVERIQATDNADLTINASEDSEVEKVDAFDQSAVTVNVTGEAAIEDISGYDDASVTVKGTNCQKKDTLELGEEGETGMLVTDKGSLTIDHVTINVKSKEALIGSGAGNVTIDTSKIASEDDNEMTDIQAYGTLDVRESVIDITGSVSSQGKMTIDHSDVTVKEPAGRYADVFPYLVRSNTGIDLINMKNGEVREGVAFGKQVFYVVTGDGKDVNLKADGDPAYYWCKSDAATLASTPATGDTKNASWPVPVALASILVAGWAAKRRQEGLAR